MAGPHQHGPSSFTTAPGTVANLVMVVDRRGRIAEFNPACEHLTGYRLAGVRGRRFWEVLIAPEQVDAALADFSRQLQGETPIRHEHHWVTRQGKRRLVSWCSSVVRDDGGQIDYAVSSGAERQLQDDLLHLMGFERVLLGLSAQLLRLDPDTVDEGVNAALATIGEFVGADRCYVFQFDAGGARAGNSHEWCRAESWPQPRPLQDLHLDQEYPGVARPPEPGGPGHTVAGARAHAGLRPGQGVSGPGRRARAPALVRARAFGAATGRRATAGRPGAATGRPGPAAQ